MSKNQYLSAFNNEHDCDLKRDSESCLPVLPIHAQIFAKWQRKMKIYMILSSTHRRSKQVFRSHFAMMNERLRHSKQGTTFVIHPFSLFGIYREHLMCLLLMVSYTFQLYSSGFCLTISIMPLFGFVQDIIDLLLFINIIIEFFVGYYVPLTKEVVLNPKLIRNRYLKTFFFLDFLSCIPYHKVTMNPRLNLSYSIRYSVNLLRFLRLVRLRTVNKLIRELLLEFGIPESRIKWIKIMLMTLFIVHLWATLFHVLPIVWNSGKDNLPPTSWLIKARLFESEDTVNPLYNYMIALLTATTHFFGASEGDQYFIETFEKLMASCCLISGFAYGTYFVARFVQIFGATNIADSKYDEIVFQLKEYSQSKMLPEELQQRLKIYYEYKFQKKFFKEVAILDTLSEHLRHEILLFNCRHIVEKIMALKGLSRTVIGGLIANFKLEVYLQNDVIIKQGDPPFKMYFISHGTVSVHCSNGQEITHHEDGDYFGSIQDISSVSIIAAEITETFTMDVVDARYIFKLDQEVADRINKLQTDKKIEYQILSDNLGRVDHDSVLKDLRQGYILEKRRLR